MSGEWHLGAGVWIGAEAAWVPYAWINAEDDHLLRPFVATEIGGAPSNVQIEGWLRYQATSALSLALGGRYWKFDSTNAHSFRNDIFFDQAISLHTERWGGFLQASRALPKFESYPPFGIAPFSGPNRNAATEQFHGIGGLVTSSEICSQAADLPPATDAA